MKRLLIGVLLAASGLASAQIATVCEKPEWAQLHGADKDELRREYCRKTRQAASHDGWHQILDESIEKKSALGLDTKSDRDERLNATKAAGSCRVAAAYYEEALLKRFKSKPPSSCN